MSARELLDELHRELAEVEQAIRAHRYPDAPPPETSLRAFAGEQYTILGSDRRSFAYLAARFPEPPAGDFFLGLARGEGQALERLLALAASLGVDHDGLDAYQPMPGCQAYTAFVSWLALNGSRAELALAFLANLAAWGENCRRLAETPAGRCDTSCFEFFAEPAPGFEQQACRSPTRGSRPATLSRLADQTVASGQTRQPGRPQEDG